MKKTSRDYRYDLITLVYQSELWDKKIDSKKLFEEEETLTPFQIKQLEVIDTQYYFLKSMIEHYLSKKWPWKRISPLLRAILVVGSSELVYSNPKIVISEMLEISKDYSFKESQIKFVNAILDKVLKNIRYLKEKNEKK